MIIRTDSVIAEEKVRDYLLQPLDEGDKSSYLAKAVYSSDEWSCARL